MYKATAYLTVLNEAADLYTDGSSTPTGAGVHLRASAAVIVEPQMEATIPFGLDGVFIVSKKVASRVVVMPRGDFASHTLTCRSAGVISARVYNHGAVPVRINRGDALFQMFEEYLQPMAAVVLTQPSDSKHRHSEFVICGPVAHVGSYAVGDKKFPSILNGSAAVAIAPGKVAIIDTGLKIRQFVRSCGADAKTAQPWSYWLHPTENIAFQDGVSGIVVDADRYRESIQLKVFNPAVEPISIAARQALAILEPAFVDGLPTVKFVKPGHPLFAAPAATPAAS